MKTIRYFIVGILLGMLVPTCHSQEITARPQVIVLQGPVQSVPDSAWDQARTILSNRLQSMNIRVSGLETDRGKGQFVIHYQDTINPASLAELLCAHGKFSLCESAAFLSDDAIREAHANLKNPILPVLEITFRDPFVAPLEKLTRENTGKKIFLLLDDRVIFAPRIIDAIPGGKFALTGGGFSQAEVRKLAAILSNGVLPVSLYPVNSK